MAVHQEAVPPPLLSQGIFVALGDVAVQLALPATDGLHILNDREGGVRPKQDSQACLEAFPQDRLRESSHFEQHSSKHDDTRQCERATYSILKPNDLQSWQWMHSMSLADLTDDP